MSDRTGEYRYARGRVVDPQTGRPSGDEEIPAEELLKPRAGEAVSEPEREVGPEVEPELAGPSAGPPRTARSAAPRPSLGPVPWDLSPPTRSQGVARPALWIGGSAALLAIAGLVLWGMQDAEGDAAAVRALSAPVLVKPSPSSPSTTRAAGVRAIVPVGFRQPALPAAATPGAGESPEPAEAHAAADSETEAAPAPPSEAAPPPPAAVAPGPPPVAVPTVKIAINATPWALIEVDGEPVGETPLSGVELPVGRHRFVARMPDGTLRERVTHIDSDSDAVLFE